MRDGLPVAALLGAALVGVSATGVASAQTEAGFERVHLTATFTFREGDEPIESLRRRPGQ